MTVAVAGALALGDWAEAAAVAFLFALSNSLESWSVVRARRAVEALLNIAPEQVELLLNDGRTQTTPVAQIEPGQIFRVSPGSRIGLDGTVVSGVSEVDQSAITGESRLVPKEPGFEVFAGTINGNGSLDIRATKRSTETTIAKVIRLVDQAQASRSPSQSWVDRFALIYTPVVLLIAIIVALVPPLFFSQAWQPWIYQALVLLVIGCPCALVISTPVSIVAGLTGAARVGVLVKGGKALEEAARLRAIALDKTGTITRGQAAVAGIFPLSGHSERELLEIAAALEIGSSHPLAKAIIEHAKAQNLTPATAADFTIILGKGASALLDGKAYWLGSHRYLEERKQEFTFQITGHPQFGLPFGQDRLVLIFLATLAVRQRNQTVRFRLAAEMLDTFGMAKGGKEYRRIVAAFERIFGATMFFSTERSGTASTVVHRSRFHFLREAEIWYSRSAEGSAGENVITLTDEFYAEISGHPIPADLEAIKVLAAAPALLDLFMWLSYRCFVAKGPEVIPLFGPIGLTQQLGCVEYSRPSRFRAMLEQWLRTIRCLWPECPAFISTDGSALRIDRRSAVLPIQQTP